MRPGRSRMPDKQCGSWSFRFLTAGSGGASAKNSLLGHAGRHDSDIGAAFEQVGREAVSQRMQAHPFLIPAASAPRGIYGEHGLGRSLEQDAVDCSLGETGGSPANIACRGGPIDAVLFTSLSAIFHTSCCRADTTCARLLVDDGGFVP
jgi:hypothetical protein